MIIYLILLAIIIFAGAKLAPTNEFHNDFLSLKTCKGIQGICAISIVLHHLTQNIAYSQGDPGVMQPFVNLGYMMVSVFFFCSGYGLYTSYKNKKDYMKGFLKKRLPTVLVPLYLVNTLCTIIVLLSGTTYYTDLNPLAMGMDSLIFKITTFLGITLMYSDAWFVICIAIFYTAFYVFFKNNKDENKAIRNLGIFVILYAVLGMCLPPVGIFWVEGEWWYNSSFIFFIGILAAKNEKRIIAFAKEKYKVLLPLCLIGAVGIWYGAIALDATGGAYGHGISGALGALLCYLCKTPGEILFVSFVFLAAMKLKVNNIFSNFLGKISYEIYLTHGIFLGIFRSQAIHIQNDIVFFALVIVSAIISSIILKKVDSKLVNIIKNKLNKNETSPIKSLNADI